MEKVKLRHKKEKFNLIIEEKVQQQSSTEIFKEYLKKWPSYQIVAFILINFAAEVLLTSYFRIISFI